VEPARRRFVEILGLLDRHLARAGGALRKHRDRIAPRWLALTGPVRA